MTTLKSIAVLAVAALVVAGCGSSGKSGGGSGTTSARSGTPAKAARSGGGGAATRLTNEADEDGGLYFKKRTLKAKAGKVTLTMENPKTSGKQHGISIEGHGVDKDGKIVSPGGKSSVTVSLKPGRYEFYCPVPGHEQAGMKGTLIVQ